MVGENSMKFLFKKSKGFHLHDMMDFEDAVMERLHKYISSLPDSSDWEMIIRKPVNWDTSRMRKFFEGPVVEFGRDCYKHRGQEFGKGYIRDALKYQFIGHTEGLGGMQVPISTTTLDRKKFYEFLRDIGDWLKDEFGQELPTLDEVDEGD
jgi:hypothetical protein